MNEEHRHKNRFYIIPGILVATASISVGLATGFWLGNEVFRYTGRPSDFWAYIISGLLGILVLGLVIRTVLWIIRKTGHADNRSHMISETLDAISRISKGDFSVSLQIKEHDPFTELNKSVNKMAQELGSMETLRQDFISNVSHEIQSPLTSITGFASLLKTNSLTDEQRSHYLNIIETESKRLSKLSDNLLKLSSLEAQTVPLTPHEFRLDKQIRNAVLMLEPQWSEKNINIDVELEKISINSDEELLSQVWINLLHNAVKFTPANGAIHISLVNSEDKVECRIADNGIGISESDKIHIFERFYKVDKSRDRSLGGNGLGLSLCKKIVELHSGAITLESTPGKGTTFIVSLKK
jgi:signal transduction histidine kinase